MEIGSGSSSSSGCSDSLHGLKFGQKIYFEDVGVGAPAKSGVGLSSAVAAGGVGKPPPTAPKKGRSAVVQTGQPPRCQVEGCKVDLSDAKAYYSRHKVCGMHSKTPKVTVAGLEQRFCQQCSRFHQLPEFDQGKRSCRRRLAGHNERRRKPPPGSLLSTRYGRLSSSVFETSKGGGFVMDFSTFPRFPEKDTWPSTRTSDQVSNHQVTATGRFLPHPLQGDSENPPTNLFLQGSASGNNYSGSTIPSGECFTGVSDSGCALSLLSNQPWASRDRPSSLGVNNFLNTGGPMVQSASTHGATVNRFSSSSWGFKSNEASVSSHEMLPHLGLRQISHPATSQYSAELELAQQSARQYMELELSRAYETSTQHKHWSL